MPQNTNTNGNPQRNVVVAPRDVLGSARTRGYVGADHRWWRRPRDLPVFTWEIVDAMLLDPTIRLGLAMREAPLLATEFGQMVNGQFQPGIEASSDEVSQFVESQLKSVWLQLPCLLSAQAWGWSAAEVCYEAEDGQVVFSELLPRHARDTRCIEQDGEVVGVQFERVERQGCGGKVSLLFPKCVFHAFAPEPGQFYGSSILIGCLSPWADKWLDGGALDVRRLFMHKDAYGGMDIGYPPGTTNIDGTGEVPNRDIARELVEQIQSGGVTARPSTVDPDTGKEMWPITRATVPANPQHILQYPKDLDVEILRGMEISDDVLTAEQSGAWAGKLVPMQAFYAGLERWRTMLLSKCIVPHIIEPLVTMNYGSKEWFHVQCKPLAQQAMEQQNGPAAGGQPPGAPGMDSLGGMQSPQDGAPMQLSLESQVGRGILDAAKVVENAKELANAAKAIRMAGRRRPGSRLTRALERAREAGTRLRTGQEAPASVWQPYRGEHSGRGWRHSVTGEVRYQEQRPQERGRAGDEPASQPPAAKQDDDLQNATWTNPRHRLAHEKNNVTHLPGTSKSLVGYHVTTKENARKILENGFDLSHVRPRWMNDLAVSLNTGNVKDAAAYFQSADSPFDNNKYVVLKVGVRGIRGDADALRRVSAGSTTPQEWASNVQGAGFDLQHAGGVAYVYNTDAIRNISVVGDDELSLRGVNLKRPYSPPPASTSTEQLVGDEVAKPTSAAPRKSKAKIDARSDTPANRRAWDSAFRGRIPFEDAPSMVGAPDDATVTVDASATKVSVEIEHPGFHSCSRTFNRNTATGTWTCKNSIFVLRDSHKGSGLGTQVLHDQATNLQARGFAYIETHAAGQYVPDRANVKHVVTKHDADEAKRLFPGAVTVGDLRKTPEGKKWIATRQLAMNGYYTWPSLGYDQELAGTLRSSQIEVVQRIVPGAQTVLDVMATPEGRDWWLKNGKDLVDAKFDLTPGSRSMMIVTAKYAEKQAKKNAGDAKQPATPASAAAMPQDRPQTEGRQRAHYEGHAATAVARWMGRDGWSHADAVKVFRHLGIPISPNTLREALPAGRQGIRGTPAELSEEHAQRLRNIRSKKLSAIRLAVDGKAKPQKQAGEIPDVIGDEEQTAWDRADDVLQQLYEFSRQIHSGEGLQIPEDDADEPAALTATATEAGDGSLGVKIEDTIRATRLATAAWQPFRGTHGGRGWKHAATGEIRYQDKAPEEQVAAANVSHVGAPHDPPFAPDMERIADRIADYWFGGKAASLSTSTANVTTEQGKVSRRLVAAAYGPQGFIAAFDKRGRVYIHDSRGKLQQATEHAIPAIRKAMIAARIADEKDAHAYVHQFDRPAADLAAKIAAMGLSVTIHHPHDSTSRYLYVELPNGGQYKVRFADHGQPSERDSNGQVVPVGGYDKDTGMRHSASDISIDPQSNHSAEDAIAALKETLQTGKPGVTHFGLVDA